MRTIKLIAIIIGSLLLVLLLLIAGFYGYFLNELSQAAQPDESRLDRAAIAQPHYFPVQGTGKVRLSVTADWLADGLGYNWRYTTQIDYQQNDNGLWHRIATEVSKRAALRYSDQYRIGEQVLITNVRDTPQTNFVHGFQTFYLWSNALGAKTFSFNLRNPYTLSFPPAMDSSNWQHYDRVIQREIGQHEIAVWSALVKHMSQEESCWYAADASPVQFNYYPEQASVEVLHQIQHTRRLIFRFNRPGEFPELQSIETVGASTVTPYSPAELRQINASGRMPSSHYVEPIVFRDLQQQQHPCVAFYQKHDLVRPDDMPGPGFLYPAQ